MAPTIKAAIYARYSTDKQTESTIADQIRVCTEYAKREGMRVQKTYDDKGISGAAVGNRPALLRMQEAAQAREVDVLLIADLSRLSRSQADLAKIIDRLIAKGVRVIGVQDGFDSARKGHKLQSGLTGIIGEAFREMVKDKTYAALESRAKDQKPTGGRAYGYEDRTVNKEQAAVVRQIFKRYAAGAGCRAIAKELNDKGIASPGSSWKRTARRATGWMNSAVRVILRNPVYIGQVVWNKAEWTKDPDTGKRRYRIRPEAEWITHKDDSLRIIDQPLWDQVQRRIGASESAETGKPKHSGGRARFVFSGLLVCGDCGANFVMADSRAYVCSSHVGGGACDNKVRLPRKVVESKILAPIQKQLLDPAAVAELAKEMQRYYRDQMRQRSTAAGEVPEQIQELDARLAKLKERLKQRDYGEGMTADDLAAVIQRISVERQRLLDADIPAARKEAATVMALLPRAAALYRKQIADGLSGDPEAAAIARTALKELTGGIRIERSGKAVFAVYHQNKIALTGGRRFSGSGGRI